MRTLDASVRNHAWTHVTFKARLPKFVYSRVDRICEARRGVKFAPSTHSFFWKCPVSWISKKKMLRVSLKNVNRPQSRKLCKGVQTLGRVWNFTGSAWNSAVSNFATTNTRTLVMKSMPLWVNLCPGLVAFCCTGTSNLCLLEWYIAFVGLSISDGCTGKGIYGSCRLGNMGQLT